MTTVPFSFSTTKDASSFSVVAYFLSFSLYAGSTSKVHKQSSVLAALDILPLFTFQSSAIPLTGLDNAISRTFPLASCKEKSNLSVNSTLAGFTNTGNSPPCFTIAFAAIPARSVNFSVNVLYAFFAFSVVFFTAGCHFAVWNLTLTTAAGASTTNASEVAGKVTSWNLPGSSAICNT